MTTDPHAAGVGDAFSVPPFMPEWAWNATAVLVGAIIGALVAGGVAWWLERRRLEWEHERERRTFVAALDAELEVLILTVEEATTRDPLSTLTGLAGYRHSTHVFLRNTDKLGLLGKENARNLIMLYSSALSWMSAGENLERQMREAADNEDRKGELLSYAARNVSDFAGWLKLARRDREELGRLVR
jgi:hypothetical protein